MDQNTTPPKVFISYSWSSIEYEEWIVNLAERLIHDGVDVILDKWHLKAGQDKFRFMETMVTDTDVKHVLLMCDPRYAEKADSRTGGVGTETQIVSQEVYSKTEQRKFIPVITKRREDSTDPLPAYLSSRMYVDLSEAGKFAAEYEKLLRLIFDKPALKRPTIGKPPAFLSASDAMSATTHLLRQSSITIGNNAIQSSGTNGRLKKSILSDLRALRLESEPERSEIDVVILSKIQELKTLRDVTLEWMRILFETNDDNAVVDELVTFFEELISISSNPKLYEWCSDHLSFFVREVWIYAIAILVEDRRWSVIRLLLDTTLCATQNGTFQPVGYSAIDCHLQSLEEIANSKKEQRRVSVLADLVKSRADDSDITFEMLMQADFLLCLRGILAANKQDVQRWFPRTLVYATRRTQPFSLFVRWRVGQMTDGIHALLRVHTRKEIHSSLIKDKDKIQTTHRFGIWRLDFLELADLAQFEQEYLTR